MNYLNMADELEEIAIHIMELGLRLKVLDREEVRNRVAKKEIVMEWKKREDPEGSAQIESTAKAIVETANRLKNQVSENPKKRNLVPNVPRTPAAVKRWLRKQNFSARRFCVAAGIAQATYYTWLRNGPTETFDSVTPRIVTAIQGIEAGKVKP